MAQALSNGSPRNAKGESWEGIQAIKAMPSVRHGLIGCLRIGETLPTPFPDLRFGVTQKLTRLTITTDSDSAARLTTADGGVLEMNIQDSVTGSHPIRRLLEAASRIARLRDHHDGIT